MEKPKYQNKVIDGVVQTIKEKETNSGKKIVETRIINEDAVYLCVLWEDLAHDFLSRNMMNRKIHVEGYVRDDGSINVKYFSSDAVATRGAIKQSQEEIDSLHKYQQRWGIVRVPWKREGLLPEVVAIHKSRCVLVNGRWLSKIEYCCDTLGDKAVYEQLREFKDDGSPGSVKPVKPEVYNRLLNEMLSLCASATGDDVQLESPGDAFPFEI